MEGFIDSQNCNFVIVVGDLNVDFDRGGEHAKLLVDFMVELNLYSCDLSFPHAVGYTYQHDDGVVHSWLDHILCSQHISTLVTDVYAVHTGSNLSDHDPLFFQVNLQSLSFPTTKPGSHQHTRVVSIGLRLLLMFKTIVICSLTVLVLSHLIFSIVCLPNANIIKKL